MTWNHRVVQRPDRYGNPGYAIHEVYYDDEGTPHSCTTDSISPYGETPEDLAAELQRMLKACSLPVIDYSVFEEREKKEPE